MIDVNANALIKSLTVTVGGTSHFQSNGKCSTEQKKQLRSGKAFG